MYVPYREDSRLSFNFPWDRNTARGFAYALIITALFVFFGVLYKMDQATGSTATQVIRIPWDSLSVISFGMGDGTGRSHGNLTEEGMKHKGSPVTSNLEDATIAAQGPHNKNAVTQDPTSSTMLKASASIASAETSNMSKDGNGARNIGSPNGSMTGTGLGSSGNGVGAGYGLGDIDWLGGGNRWVVSKKVPVYPKGAAINAQIKVRFVVAADGRVTDVMILKKGDPALEKAATDAIRQWRFNALKENKDMVGIITFTFKLT